MKAVKQIKMSLKKHQIFKLIKKAVRADEFQASVSFFYPGCLKSKTSVRGTSSSDLIFLAVVEGTVKARSFLVE
jgi:hypothetical protein